MKEFEKIIKEISEMEDVVRGVTITNISGIMEMKAVMPKEQRKPRPVSKQKLAIYKDWLVRYGLFDGNFIVAIDTEGTIYILDGGHRKRFLKAIKEGKEDLPYEGKMVKYDELPEEIREKIGNMQATITYYKNVPMNIIFKYYNGGNSLSTSENIHSDNCNSDAWEITEKFVSNKNVISLVGGKGKDPNHNYCINMAMAQVIGLTADYLMQSESNSKDTTKIKFTTKPTVKRKLFNDKNDYGKYLTSKYIEKLEAIFDIMNNKQLLDLFGNRKRQSFTNLSYCLFRVIDEVVENGKISGFEEISTIFTDDFKPNLREALKENNYEQYFGDGQNKHQIPELYRIVKEVANK